MPAAPSSELRITLTGPLSAKEMFFFSIFWSFILATFRLGLRDGLVARLLFQDARYVLEKGAALNGAAASMLRSRLGAGPQGGQDQLAVAP
ncbi:MAG: hypothetical protein E6699_39370, partial [Bradyrhizobium sp.]|uniref:hypothetical protein n=1 Tax=Bradyrhizobium sp. TaxID=376 RepID=UPI00290374B5